MLAARRRDEAFAIAPFEEAERPRRRPEKSRPLLAHEQVVRAGGVARVVQVVPEAAERRLEQLDDGIVRRRRGIEQRADDVRGREDGAVHAPPEPLTNGSVATVGVAPPIANGRPTAMFGALTTPRSAIKIAA